MRYFNLDDDEKFKSFWWDDEKIELETIHCPIDKGHQGPGKRISDLTVIPKPRRYGDIMWTVYSECLIGEKVARAFRKADLSGYKLKPVKISPSRGKIIQQEEIPKYWELQVLGWGGMARPESGIHLKEKCNACGLLVYTDFNNPSKLLDESQWDGSDLFMIWPLPRFIFVTEKVKEVIEDEHFRGCSFVPPEELSYESDDDLLNELSPGRLHHWMPEKSARKLGKPLGIY